MGLQNIELEEAQQRARKIKLLLTDVDGVLTDTGVYYGPEGEAFKRFSIRDGMGIEILRDNGIETAMITRENSPSVRARSEKLQMKYGFFGLWDKLGHLPKLLEETGLQMEELAYIGDDVNDLEIITELSQYGLTAAPLDAMPEIVRRVHYHAEVKAGHGALRDFADWILSLNR